MKFIQCSKNKLTKQFPDNKNPFPSSPSLLKSLLGNIQNVEEPQPPISASKKVPNGKNQKTKIRNEKTLLGELYEDKKYLEKLLNRPGIEIIQN